MNKSAINQHWETHIITRINPIYDKAKNENLKNPSFYNWDKSMENGASPFFKRKYQLLFRITLGHGIHIRRRLMSHSNTFVWSSRGYNFVIEVEKMITEYCWHKYTIDKWRYSQLRRNQICNCWEAENASDLTKFGLHDGYIE